MVLNFYARVATINKTNNTVQGPRVFKILTFYILLKCFVNKDMPGEESFATPQAKKICLDGAGVSATPGKSVTTFEIPPSPCLKRLGFGTGKLYKVEQHINTK